MNRSPTDKFHKECGCVPELEEDPALSFFDEDVNESQESEWLGSADTEQSAILKNIGQEFELGALREIDSSDYDYELPDNDVDIFEINHEWQQKIMQGNRPFIRWLQKALNKVENINLPINGRFTLGTQMAVIIFKRKWRKLGKLKLKPEVDNKTVRELIARSADPPPSYQPDLRDLRLFSKKGIREELRNMRNPNYPKSRCAELIAILWNKFERKFRLPVRYNPFFINAGNVSFMRNNTVSIGRLYQTKCGHRHAVTGDIYLYRFIGYGPPVGFGDVLIFNKIKKYNINPMGDIINVVQGDFFPQPLFTPAYRNIRARDLLHLGPSETIYGKKYSRDLIGNGPRRYIGFQHLR